MLTAPTAEQLENVPIAVSLQDYAVGFVAVQVQEQLQWNGANNMMEHVQQGAAGRAAGLGVGDRAHRHQHRRLQKTASTPWSSSSRARWSSAGQPGLPEMLAIENAALHKYFESGLRSWRLSSPRSVVLQMVPDKLNDKLITSDAMRRKLAHGIGQALQKCSLERLPRHPLTPA